jgi:hypothetical protein
MLKKEFTQRDVTRARNLLTGKTGDRTAIQTGYEKHTKVYKEGDVWEEDDKTWTIKDGLKQTVTKHDALRRLASLPLVCPNCANPMKITDLNKKMYAIHQECFDCVIERETKLKAEGKYLEYEKQMINGNKNAMLADLEQAIDGWMQETSSFVSEDGVVEDWSKGKRDTTTYDEFKEAIKKAKEQEI